jgi:hypothetical protein
MTQPDLFTAPCPSSDVETLIGYLEGKGWIFRRQIERALGWNDRKIREVAHASQGQIISGDQGYCLTLQASVEDVGKFVGRIQAQRASEQQRILDVEKVFHSRRVSAA